MPNRSSLAARTAPVQLLAPANRTATATSNVLDTRDCDDVALLFSVGAPGDTLAPNLKAELEVQESDDNATFTPVANTDLTYSEAGTNVGTAKVIDGNAKANSVYIVGYKGYKRFIRCVDRRTGAHTNGTPTAINALKGRNRVSPTNN